MWLSVLLSALVACGINAYDWDALALTFYWGHLPANKKILDQISRRSSSAILQGYLMTTNQDDITPLDEYVHFDDGYYSWTELTSYRFEENKTTVYMLNMTSQKWIDESFSSRSIWWHMMAVAVPDEIVHDAAFMYIEGGSNGAGTGPAPADDALVRMTVEIATRVGAVGAYIRQVPNQSIVFANDPTQSSKSEDKIIAWTWKTFLDENGARPEVIARFPFTKAAKRGFDAIHDVVMEKTGVRINRFIPGGGSKRGWTTWSVAATDRRVIAATPIVMSLLNFNDTLQSHYRNLGGWTFVFNDYWELNLTQRFHDDLAVRPGGLFDYEDMFRFKERLELIPKLMVSAAGDEFFLITDSHNWWDQMGGPKWIQMVPNAEHSLVPWYRKVGETIASFCYNILNDLPMPRLSWLRSETPTGGLLRFQSSPEPDELYLYQSFTWRNDTRKDYRLAVGYPPFIHPVLWRKTDFITDNPGLYRFEGENPDIGFVGYFFEAVYLGNGFRLTLTTEAQITPYAFPFPGCYGEACWGTLT